MVSFLVPNRRSNKPLEDFLMTIDDLKGSTKLDFFENRLKKWQAVMEGTVDA